MQQHRPGRQGTSQLDTGSKPVRVPRRLTHWNDDKSLPPRGRRRAGLRDLHARSRGLRPHLERRRGTHQGLPRRRDHRPALLGVLPAGRDRREAGREHELLRGRAKSAASRTKAGACARTARSSGPTSSSRACSTTTARVLGFSKITRDLTERRAPRRTAAPQRRALPPARRGRARLRDLHARPRRARRQLERRRASGQGLPGRRRSSAATSPCSIRPRCVAAGWPERELDIALERRPLRRRRLARAQGRHALLGERGDHRAARRSRPRTSASRRSRAT